MATKAKLLENIQADTGFIDKMDSVFRDLRADFEVSSLLYYTEKINELKKVHVDTTGDVSTLATLSVASNGIIKGLRGSGKSHLLLLSRNKINLKKDSFCVYINLKEHFNIGGTPELDERFYVWVILTQLKSQLKLLPDKNDETNDNFIGKLISIFSKAEIKNKTKLEKIFQEMDDIISFGEKELAGFEIDNSSGNQIESANNAEISSKLSITSAELSGKMSAGIKNISSDNLKFESKMILNINKMKSLIVKIVEVLGLKSIVFYYDEWSSRNKDEQEKLSKLIQALSTSPLFHWIAYIPHKSTLGVLELSADMPHQIELDLKYIYEENNQVCKEYFLEFANNRFRAVFNNEECTVKNLFSQEYINHIILASMGNTRDFGILLQKSWTNYKEDVLAKKRCRIINKTHIVKAIKSLSKEKMENLRSQGSNYSEHLWNEIIKFVTVKRHTNFCIEMNQDNQSYINHEEMQDLLYYRLVHLRKTDLPSKDGSLNKLTMYAVDIGNVYSKIYEIRSDKINIKVVTDLEVIHNQVRRYTFDLAAIINLFRVQQGRQIICKKCGKSITSEMKLAWEMKKCIYCGESF